MSNRVNTDLWKDLRNFGLDDWNHCFHCGNCTGTCPLTSENSLFPRSGIRSIQMGLKDKIATNLDPWLCYYCGDCSEKCPQDANPGELMMSLRRYLTSVYDWTGLSRKFYTSKSWEFAAIGIIAAVVIVLFVVFLPPSANISTNPDQFINEQGGVMINSLVDNIDSKDFLKYIEWGDWIMAIIVAFLLVSNIFNMFLKVIIKDKKIKVPLYAYITEFWHLIWNFGTQQKFSKCEKKSYWIGHLALMTGYTIMFTVIVGLLPRFQIEEIRPWYNWQRILGYYATIGIIYFLLISAIQRIRKNQIHMKFSHPSDWIFIVLLGLTTITGILIHFFRIYGLPAATYYTYVIHLAILVPMIIIEVPFSKWSHLAYRPFAVYFARLKKIGSLKKQKIELAAAA